MAATAPPSVGGPRSLVFARLPLRLSTGPGPVDGLLGAALLLLRALGLGLTRLLLQLLLFLLH